MASLSLFRFFARFHLWKPAVLLEQAQKSFDSGDLNLAEELSNRAIQRAPEWAEPAFMMARIAKSRQQKSEEEGWLMHTLDCDSRHTDAEKALLKIRAWQYQPIMLGWKRFHAAEFGAAGTHFSEALEQIPERVPEMFRAEVLEAMGWCAWESANYEAGIAHFRAALEHEPDRAGPHKGLGMCLFRANNPAAAEASLMRALQINPDLFDARAFRGWVACSQAQWQSALEHFEASRKINALSGDACWGLAWACANLGRISESFVAYREAFQLEPDHATRAQTLRWFMADSIWNEMLLPFAMSLLKAGRGEAALEVLEASFGKVPRVQWAGGRAFALLQLGRPREVESALSRLETSELDLLLETGHTPRQLKALAAQAQGHFEAALGHMELAMKHSDHLGLRLDMALLWSDIGATNKAIELYSRLLDEPQVSASAAAGLASLEKSSDASLLDALESHLTGGLAHGMDTTSDNANILPGASPQAIWLQALQAQSLGDFESALTLIRSQIQGNLTPSAWFLFGAQVADKLGDLRLSREWKSAASSYLAS